MQQSDYLEHLISSINNGIELPYEEVVNHDFIKLQPFHKELLWNKSIENCSIYYEQIFSKFHYSQNIGEAFSTLLQNTKVSLLFWEHFFTKNPNSFITKDQEKIIDYPFEYFPLLFSKTVFTPHKMTHCLFKLFQEPQNNIQKIEFIIENQKKKFLPFHNDMYYLILFFAYMKKNSEKKRKYFSSVTNTIEHHPVKITKDLIFTSQLIHNNFNNIFDFIKPNLVKRAYTGQSFSNTISNENDFSYFIDFVAASLQKNKIEEKFAHLTNVSKQKPNKI